MSLIITNNYNKNYENASSIYDFSAYDSNGNLINLKEKYFGKVCLILNATVKGQEAKGILKNLKNIRNTFKEKDFAILLFPCFQFGSSDTVKGFVSFLKENSFENVFDVFNEVQVNGPEASELFKYLKLKQRGFTGGIINKNFTMFLTNKGGDPVQRYVPTIHPEVVISDVKELM